MTAHAEHDRKARSSGKVAPSHQQNRWEPENGISAVRAGLVDAVQVISNIFDQIPRTNFSCLPRKDVAVIARVPFDEGSLTGTLTLDSTWPKGDWRNTYLFLKI